MTLQAKNIGFSFDQRNAVLDGLSLTVNPGEILGVAGVSGCGKSTLARILSGYLQPQSGQVLLDGAPLPRSGFNPVQFVHQTAVFAVNPRWTIGRILAEPGSPDPDIQRRLGVPASWMERYPHEVSGGELQRVALLRALQKQTRYLIADEVTAMLDPVAQSEIWHALLEIAAVNQIGIVAVSHDPALLAQIATHSIELSIKK